MKPAKIALSGPRSVKLTISLFAAVVIGLAGGERALAQHTNTAQPTSKGVRTQSEIAALIRLADTYYYAESIGSDFKKAFIYYSKAAEAGSASSKIRVGEMIAKGLGTERNYERGRTILEESAATGDAKALTALGELYVRGEAGPMDPVKALNALEAAAAKGDPKALLLLGDIYQYGRFSSPNSKKALRYYRQAAEAGNPYGLYSAGNVLVRAKAARHSTVMEGVALLQRAERDGIQSATIAISNSIFYGVARRAEAKRALALLVNAMEHGNLEAGKELVAIYRDGKQDGRVKLIRRNLSQAQTYFNTIKKTLSMKEQEVEVFLLDAAKAPATRYQEFLTRIGDLDKREAQLIYRELRSVNPAMYIFLTQSKLKELGLFTGKVSGKYNISTVKAVFSYCRRTGTRYFCSQGPFSSQSAELLSYAF